MRRIVVLGSFVFLILLSISAVAAAPTWKKNPKGFLHGIVIDLGDGEDWYFKGGFPPWVDPWPNSPGIGSEVNAIDVPGHTWVQTAYRVEGRHYNTGPYNPSMEMAVPKFWTSDADNGVLLFVVDGIIAPWTLEISEKMASLGYVHYHELVRYDAIGGLWVEHPTYVVWLKHTAIRSFDFNGGPRPDLGHLVTPGVDYEFMPNWMNPYIP